MVAINKPRFYIFGNSLSRPPNYMNETYQLHCGNLILHRQEKDFRAAFCITRAGLQALAADLSVLHPHENEYYNSLRFDRRRQSYLLGRLTAKKAVSQLAGVDAGSFYIDQGIFDFPVVKGTGQNIQATISHCDDIGLALAFPEEHPLGLDIEHISSERGDAMKSQVSPAEEALLKDCNIPLLTGYAIAWTIKEAFTKIIRTGLTMDLRLTEIKSLEKNNRQYLAAFRHFSQYKAICVHCGDYACAVVLPAKTTVDLNELWNRFSETVS
jgi:4'-phosphopantetheinyl transferase